MLDNILTTSKTKTTEYQLDTYLPLWIEAFLTDRQAGNKAPGTMLFYKQKLGEFMRYCDSVAVTRVDQLTPGILREYLIAAEAAGHNSGGVHAMYRVIRTFLYWYEDEAEPENWKNPIRKVKAPRLVQALLEPCDMDAVNAILDTCKTKHFTDLRDKAVFLFLLDTGLRASEVTHLDVGDVDTVRGSVLVRQGKGRKPRTVFIGKRTRKAIRAYMRVAMANKALFTNDEGERLPYAGLATMVRRRSARAGVAQPSLHSFRRFFALTYLRNGGDIMTLQRLMGHADLQVLRRYLNQTDTDLQKGHAAYGPVDSL